MTIQRDTLFSISNEALKKEKKDLLFLMRLGFIFYCIVFIADFTMSLYVLPQASLSNHIRLGFFLGGYTFELSPIEYVYSFLCLALFGLSFFFFLRALWRMELWVYDLFFLLFVLSLFSLFLFVELPLFIPIIAAWEVRSFLRALPDEERKTLSINTSTLREFFRENITATREQTLFSLKGDALRKQCPISLFFVRGYVILCCLMGVLAHMYLSIIVAVTPFHINHFIFYLGGAAISMLLWWLLKLNMYIYSLFGILSLSTLFLEVIEKGSISSDSWYSFFVLAGTIAAWRVHICLRTVQKQDEHEQEALEKKEDEQEVTEQEQDEQVQREEEDSVQEG